MPSQRKLMLAPLRGRARRAGRRPASSTSTPTPTARSSTRDKIPSESAGKPNEQLNRQGTVTKRNEGAMTPEQRAAKEADRKRKLDEDMAAKEAEAQEHGAAQHLLERAGHRRGPRACAQDERGGGQGRRAASSPRCRSGRKKLATEAEFYKKKPMPAQLKQDIQVNEAAIDAHDRAARQEAEGDRCDQREVRRGSSAATASS